VPHGDGSFHIEEDIAVDRVKYKHAEDVKESVSPTKPEPVKTDAKVEAEPDGSKPEPYFEAIQDAVIEKRRCPVASPSTLTNSDTTMEQPNSGIRSNQSSQKRKTDHRDESPGQIKRSCSKSDGPTWTPPKRLSVRDQEPIPKQLYPYCSMSDTGAASNDCRVEIPLQDEHVSDIIGPNGQVIRDIQNQTGCIVDIIGKGIKRRGFDNSTQPLHARIVGKSAAAVDRAAGMIQCIMNGNKIVPLEAWQVPFIVGPNGQVVNEIQKQTGCVIDIRGKGNKRKDYDDSNQPLHARIAGKTPAAVDRAAEIIQGIIDGKSLKDIVNTESHPYSVSHHGCNDGLPNQVNPRGMYCKVNFPPWLVYDDSTKARLHRKWI
jgi:hypothetical protein